MAARLREMYIESYTAAHTHYPGIPGWVAPWKVSLWDQASMRAILDLEYNNAWYDDEVPQEPPSWPDKECHATLALNALPWVRHMDGFQCDKGNTGTTALIAKAHADMTIESPCKPVEHRQTCKEELATCYALCG